MLKILLVSFLLSSAAFASNCEDVIGIQKFEIGQVLTDNLTRRTYEEYINKSWPQLGNDIYMRSSQGMTVDRQTTMMMNQLYNFYVERLKDALNLNYGSGLQLNSEKNQNDINNCLSSEIKEKCNTQISEYLSKFKELESFQNKYRKNMFELVSMIDNFKNGVENAANSNQVYSTNDAFNFINSINKNTDVSTEFKGWININAREAKDLADIATQCIYKN